MTPQLDKRAQKREAIRKLKLNLITSIIALILIILSMLFKKIGDTTGNPQNAPVIERVKKIEKKVGTSK